MRHFLNVFEEVKPDKLITPTLKYKANQLKPVMSEDTINYHYGTLAKGYAKRFNANEGDGMFNFKGHQLHAMFFPQFKKPRGTNKPTGQIAEFIDSKFGTYDDLKEQMKSEAMGIQGSGWIFVNNMGRIETIKNHDITGNPQRIIILIDWWEHAWALDYQADKSKYFNNIWKLFDWDIISQRLY